MENKIDCTGDACVGDKVTFERAVFIGKYPKAKFSHNEKITGTIVKDSYGEKKQQHTFTISTSDGDVIRIKGRNLYRNGTTRELWEDEEKRKEVINEKHNRGNAARIKASERKSYKMTQIESDYIDNYNESYSYENE